MPNPKTPGRMIRRSIAISRGVAKLGPDATAIFCMILPHLDAYGKMLGEPAVVKEVALPLAKWATVNVIAKALRGINRHTNLKWWRDKDGRRYLHAIHFENHQDLRADRRGGDHLPSFPGVSPPKVPELVPELVPPEVEVEVEVKQATPLSDADASSVSDKGNGKSKPRKRIAYTPEFEEFWSEYPRQLRKELAFKKFQTCLKEYDAADVIGSAIEYDKVCRKDGTAEKHILHPTTFLTDGRWKDYCFED